jgi:hypothetical protein
MSGELLGLLEHFDTRDLSGINSPHSLILFDGHQVNYSRGKPDAD